MAIKRSIRHATAASAFWLVCVAPAGCAGTDWRRRCPPPDSPELSQETGTRRWADAPRHELSPAPPPAEGYDWDVLARMAAANGVRAQALSLEADADLERAAADGAWRSPQLRLAGQGGNGGRDRNRAGLRIHTASPFVGHWRRRAGIASANAKEASAGEEAYAAFCEVRELCLEAELLREEDALLEAKTLLRRQLLSLRQEQAGVGVGSPTAEIRARTRLMTSQTEMLEKRTARQQLIRRIATLTGIPAENLRLRTRDSREPLSARWLDPALLIELALQRRPDLARAEQETEAAEYDLKMAKAGRIPWIDYVEGAYENEGSGTAWEQRVAISLPVGNWLGKEVRFSESRLRTARTRENGLRERIRTEVTGTLQDYLEARTAHESLRKESARFRREAAARLEVLSHEKTISPEDILKARESLLAYRQACLQSNATFLRLAQRLEAATGGPLNTESLSNPSLPR